MRLYVFTEKDLPQGGRNSEGISREISRGPAARDRKFFPALFINWARRCPNLFGSNIFSGEASLIN